MRRLHRLTLIPIFLAACSGDPTDGGDEMCAEGDDKCDKGDSAAAKTACDSAFVDMSGRSTKVKPGSLNDAVAKFIFKSGTDCPLSFEDVIAKLKKTDKKDCGSEDGLQTRLVSERSQTRGVPDSYRAVTTKTCDGRDDHALLFSTFGLTPAGALPEDVEVIALDESKGVFNYYVIENGKWNFHGSSADLLKGPDGDKRRCAGCHVGGGLVMKELESPWMHWEGDTDTPGAEELVTKHKAQFGTKNSGIDMESIVRAGNDVWNKKRIGELKKLGVKEVLRPLFCTREINLHNGTSGTSPVSNASGGSDVSSVPADFMVHVGLQAFDSVEITGADYRAQVTANGQRMTGGGTERLKDKDGKNAVDTIFDFAFVKPAAVDESYVQELVTAGIIDEDFVKDVLMVDLTRPVFSTERCGLLDSAPTLDAGDMKADKIRDGFISKLGAPSATSAAGIFLANLKAKNDGDAHGAKVTKFFEACGKRPKKEFLADAMQINSMRRNEVRKMAVMEFPESLPFDDLSVDVKTRFNPKTCELTTSLVAP